MKDINDIKLRMAPTGVDTEIVDVTQEMAEICFETVKCQAMSLHPFYRWIN